MKRSRTCLKSRSLGCGVLGISHDDVRFLLVPFFCSLEWDGSGLHATTKSFTKSELWSNRRQVLRGAQWAERDAVILVPGDIISIKLGDIIPADARLLEGDPLKIDQVCNSLGSLKTLFGCLAGGLDLCFGRVVLCVCVCLFK